MAKKKRSFPFFFIFFGGIGIGALYLFSLLYPFQKRGNEIIVTVPSGTSLHQFARQLKQRQIIGNERFFLLTLKLAHAEKRFQAGTYTFYKNQGIASVIENLGKARAVEFSITIPEGLTVQQTAAQILRYYPIDTTVFIRLCNSPETAKKLGISVSSLEGYLFPQTYRIMAQTSEYEIIKRMVQLFHKEFKQLTQTIGTANVGTMTTHEVVTLASIVEKEAQVPAERPHISGVFHNRLRLRMPLGADPTIRFYLKKFSGPLRVSELKNPTAYNTRLHVGLPPGPICSPGAGSLRAAFEPLETRDLYFVAKWDGSGEHDFSQTYAQHDRKKNEIQRRNEERIQNQNQKQKQKKK